MIPKCAFFTWVGDEPLPWLRQLGVDSFKKQNPDWDVEVVRVPDRGDLLAAQSTDIFRYHRLATDGGLYLDTDVLFFRPVPDELLDADVSITVDRSAFNSDPGDPTSNSRIEGYPGFNNLALLGAVPDNPFFRHMHEVAIARRAWLAQDDVDVKKLMYQVFGTELLNREFCGKTLADIEAQFGIHVYNIPLDAILPIRWYNAYKLFNGTKFDPPEDTIGVHWYGGSYDARRYQKQFTSDTVYRRPCYLTDVIDRVLA